MKEEQQERLLLLIDRFENILHSIRMPVPDSIHVQAMRGTLPELVSELKEIANDVIISHNG